MSVPKIIYLFRHGEVEDRYKKRFRGTLDCELSDAGKLMTQKNAEFIIRNQVDLVLTTGLKRTDAVGHLLKGSPVKHEVHKGFREAEFGEWEGKSWIEVQKLFPELVKLYETDPIRLQFPSGESMKAVLERVTQAWLEVIKRSENKLAVVGHSTTNTLLLSQLKGKGFRELGLQVIGSFHEIHVTKDGVRIIRENAVEY